MRQVTPETAILRVLQLTALGEILVYPTLRRIVGVNIGNEPPLGQWLVVVLLGPLSLLGFTSIPWFRQRLGNTFLPVTLALFSVYAMLDKYVTLSWLTPPALQELNAVLFMVRLWLLLQIITGIVATRYRLGWVFLIGLVLSLVDGALSLPFISRPSELYPVFVVILIVRTFTVSLVSAGIAWLIARLREQRDALANANRRLAQYASASEQLAVSQERNRLARELHDTLAHSLSGVTVQLEAVNALWDVDPIAAHTMLDHTAETARSGLTEARRALRALRASPLEDLGLSLAIINLAESTAARAGLRLDLDVPIQVEKVPPEVEQCVYRVAQESLTNVARHADAQEVHVALTRQKGNLSLTVADDGCGFDTNNVDDTRYGLRGLKERAHMVGGALRVESQPQLGTIVNLTIALGGQR